MYAENNCVFSTTLPRAALLHAQLQPRLPRLGASQWACAGSADPIVIQLYLGAVQKFRLAAQGKTPAAAAGIADRERVERLLRSAAVLVSRRSKTQATDTRRLSAARDHAAADGDVPLVGLAERVAAPDPRRTTTST